jgi:heme-degrading monooxygenase HmoA
MVMLASVTRLRVRSVRFIPAFLWRTFLSERQGVRAPGFFGGRLLLDSGLTFWTLTVWESEQAMRGFRGSGAHARVMSRLARWCNEAAYAHWVQMSDHIPTWDEAYERLVAEGRLSRVERPSKNHSDRQFARPRLKPLIGLDLKPKGSARIKSI